MGKLIRRGVILLLPIAWSWYWTRRRTRHDGERRASPDHPETGTRPAG